jgi:hypothetical protein
MEGLWLSGIPIDGSHVDKEIFNLDEKGIFPTRKIMGLRLR